MNNKKYSFSDHKFPFYKKKKKNLAITLHNITPKYYQWLEATLDMLMKDFEFKNPINLSNIIENENRSLFLTFDDGFKSNRFIAERILKPRGIKAIFFITAGFINLKGDKSKEFVQKNYYPKRSIEESYQGEFDSLTIEDLKWLVEEGHQIGAHTENHPLLSKLEYSKLNDEITKSANKLEKMIGKPIKHFAYPFGSLESVNEIVFELTKNRFEFAYSNIRGFLNESPSRHFFFRQNLEPGSPFWKVKAIVDGRINWRYRKERLKAIYYYK
tara:strand:- start:211 stop:1023 length:813 start_codon:yes stop_codon:yes gene_type:complete